MKARKYGGCSFWDSRYADSKAFFRYWESDQLCPSFCCKKTVFRSRTDSAVTGDMILSCIQRDAMKHTSSKICTSLLTMRDMNESAVPRIAKSTIWRLKSVRQMRDAVFYETKLTVSAGTAPNKLSIYAANTPFKYFNWLAQMLAKICFPTFWAFVKIIHLL